MRKYIHILFYSLILFGHSISAQKQVLTLEQAKTLAKNNNKKTLIATQTIEAAKSAEASVYSSDKPFIDASAMGIHVGDPLNVLLPKYQATASLGVTQVIYSGGKINTAKKMSTSAVELYTSQKELTESEVILDVETTYWQIINVGAKIDLAVKYNSLLSELLKDLTNAFDAGIIYKNDVLQVQVQLNQAELDLERAKNGLSILKLKMAQLIGFADSNFEVEGTIENSVTVTEKPSSEQVLGKRPEIKILNNAVELEALQGKILEGDSKPTVAANISGLYTTGKQINFKNGSNDLASYYGTLNVSIPVFDWGKRKQKVKEQQFKTEAKQLELEETQELVLIQVENAYLELQQAIKRIAISERSLEQAEENLRLHQDRFEAGTVIGKDVLEAQVLWQKAYTEVIDAKVMKQISLASYEKAIGEINN
ncbi:outer membrane protein TolC [Roseivirga ehrenbergii]|uniref:Transporter n=1 Tax=Roseivirga ehrenbergii (strain DSM 102268 / JCM 13514 / KCTC 12282 / NCIMB 14502 / KMM 6017) TaxID=279360 RepID=A0A150X7Y8_ROSEK|nr:TolC family protein [Roseivirga ehrenbergii]KYG74804.1 hypothetical protein MB14_06260 [Roseivirga ehrenbergii]TCL13863.1 outer membrane protein TolC [Roseivirga ehrenbergii]